MVIALDYDGTYTLDPEFWFSFIQKCRDLGHTIIIATQRTVERPVEIKLPELIPVVYCGGLTKREACRKVGFDPQIWIDDNPSVVDVLALTYVRPR